MEWESIVNAPLDGRKIFATRSGSKANKVYCIYWDNNRWIGWIDKKYPTHWMDIPEIPL